MMQHTYTVSTPRKGHSVTISEANKAEARYAMLAQAAMWLKQGMSVRVTCPVNGTWVYNNDGACLDRVNKELARLDAIGSDDFGAWQMDANQPNTAQ